MIKKFLNREFGIHTFRDPSLEGEGKFLYRYFQERNSRNGFYIDVGACHPIMHSNTYLLHKKLGFTGINIEPSSGIKYFRRFRKKDINLSFAIGSKIGIVRFTENKKEPALSFVGAAFEPNCNRLIVDMKTLDYVCEFYQGIRPIHYLDIDVEGYELEVLKGFSINKWKPLLVNIEAFREQDKIDEIMESNGYEIIYLNTRNTIYRKK